MAKHPCFDGIKEAFPSLTKDEIDKILGELEQEKQVAQQKGRDIFESLSEKGGNLSQDLDAQLEQARFHHWRGIEINNARLQDLSNWVGVNKGFAKGMLSFTQGSNLAVRGARDSIQAATSQLQGQLWNSLAIFAQDNDLYDLLNSDQHQEELLDAMEGRDSGDDRINKLGEKIGEKQREAERLLNRNGIWFDKLKNRRVRQYHDYSQLIKTSDSKAEYAKDLTSMNLQARTEKAANRWMDFIHPNKEGSKLDLDEMTDRKTGVQFKNLSEERIREILRNVYKTVSNKGKLSDSGMNMAQRASSRRFLIFKDNENFVDYNRKYGTGTVQNAIKRELQSTAQNVAVLEKFGVSPKSMITKVMKSAQKEFPEFKRVPDELKIEQNTKNSLDQVMGNNNDATSTFARIGQATMRWNVVTKLGSVLLRAFTDQAPITLETSRLMGSYSKAAVDTMTSLFPTEERTVRQEISRNLNIFRDVHAGTSIRSFGDQNTNGKALTNLMRVAGKVGGMDWWDQSYIGGTAAVLSKHLAEISDQSFKAMAADSEFGAMNRNIFEQYNIDSDMWDLIRKSPVKDIQGRKYITADGLDNVPDDTIKSFLKKKGVQRVSQTAIQDVKDDVQRKLGAYFHDRTTFAILKPDAQLPMWAHGVQSPAVRTMIKMLLQFKTYGITFFNKPVSRLLYGKGATSFSDAIFKGQADWRAVSQFVPHIMLLGYLSAQAEDIVHNRTPPPLGSRKAFLDAVSASGIFGLYGDMFEQDPNKFGGGVVNSLLGPTASNVGNVLDTLGGIPFGSTSKNQVYHAIKNNIPFANNIFAKNALDYLIFNHVQNMVSPGYFSRKRSELMKNNQNFLASPFTSL